MKWTRPVFLLHDRREIQAAQTTPPVGDPGQVALEARGLCCAGCFENVDFELRGEKFWALQGSWAQAVPSWPWHSLACGPSRAASCAWGASPVKLRSVRTPSAWGLPTCRKTGLRKGFSCPSPLCVTWLSPTLGQSAAVAAFLDKHRAARETDNWIQTLSIATDSREAAAQKLSGGQPTKGGVAKWLALKPDILILNGPTVGVDIGAKQDIYDLLRRYAGEGMSILIASDDVREVETLCNRVLVLRGGRVSRFLTGAEITQTSLTEAAI